MKQLLESKGWVMFYECNCSGGKQYFNNKVNPGYEIRTKTKNKTFSILLDNRIIAGPHWGYMLEEKMKQFIDA